MEQKYISPATLDQPIFFLAIFPMFLKWLFSYADVWENVVLVFIQTQHRFRLKKSVMTEIKLNEMGQIARFVCYICIYWKVHMYLINACLANVYISCPWPSRNYFNSKSLFIDGDPVSSQLIFPVAIQTCDQTITTIVHT